MSESLSDRPRYSTTPLPPYSYVPGFAPHPVSDPHGHMHGRPHAAPPPLDPDRWQASEAYRYGVDLFNQGFYWEAHEAWESLWHVAGRRGLVATWLKGLIKLAAAAVKLREGNAVGVERHARRALALLAEARDQMPPTTERFAGVDVEEAKSIAEQVAKSAQTIAEPQPQAVLNSWLRLQSRPATAPPPDRSCVPTAPTPRP
jgi:hypothetical protein